MGDLGVIDFLMNSRIRGRSSNGFFLFTAHNKLSYAGERGMEAIKAAKVLF
jgi:hypothetical protein